MLGSSAIKARLDAIERRLGDAAVCTDAQLLETIESLNLEAIQLEAEGRLPPPVPDDWTAKMSERIEVLINEVHTPDAVIPAERMAAAKPTREPPTIEVQRPRLPAPAAEPEQPGPVRGSGWVVSPIQAPGWTPDRDSWEGGRRW